MFCEYSKLVMLHKRGELHFRLLGTNGFHAMAKNGKLTAPYTFTAHFISCRLAQYVKKLHQKACRTCSTIIFFFQPIKSLICGAVVVVAVAGVISETPYW